MKKKPKVYVETSVISNLTSWLSEKPEQLAMQTASREWWGRKDDFELFISQYVMDEIKRGDPGAALRRLESVSGIPSLPSTSKAVDTAREFVKRHIIPAEYPADAAHIAIAAHNDMDYLVTWNQTHIHNRNKLEKVGDLLEELGLKRIEIVRPLYWKGVKREKDQTRT